MIRTNTVFVLGAGASVDCGYPTGAGLQKHILVCLGPPGTPGSLVQNLTRNGFEVELITELRVALTQSGFETIDQLLEHRTDLVEIGKAAIAWSLVQYENPHHDNLYNPSGWYRYLFRHLNCQFQEFGRNAVKFITFNYDRSLEEFLFRSIATGYGKNAEEVLGALSSIPIVHVHGSLGPLPWQEKNGRDYMQAGDLSDLKSISRSIKVIHEGDSRIDVEFQAARDLIGHAERLIFLGFGYHDTNVDRLIRGVTFQSESLEISGSFYQFTDRQMRRVVGKMRDLTHRDMLNPGREILEMNTLQFLRHHATLD